MSASSNLLHSAMEMQRGGKLEEARQLCLQLLQQEPKNAEALNLLGLISAQMRDHAQAAQYLRQAVDIDSTRADYFANLAEAHRGLRQGSEAIECYLRAVQLAPDNFEFQNNLGTLYQLAGRLDEAVIRYERAVQVHPTGVEARFNLGTALQRQGNLHAASMSYEEVLKLQPDHLRALNNLAGLRRIEGNLAAAERLYLRALQLAPQEGSLHYNLGNVYQLQQRMDQAIACYRRALELQGENVETLCNLGRALQEQYQLAEALVCLQRAVQLRPDFSPVQCNLGVTLQDLARLEEAQQCFERALALEPNKPEYLHNLGTIRKDLGDLPGALHYFGEALRAGPNYSQAACSQGTALLSIGQFAAGWPYYEHRIRCPQYDTIHYSDELWDGLPLAGRRLLLHSEQGLGDTLQFIRYVNVARRFGDSIVVAVQQELIPLLAVSGFPSLVPRDGPRPRFEIHSPLMSLPYILKTELETVPRDVPYLAADRGRAEHWRGRLGNDAGLKVGIAWQGRPLCRADRLRSMPLTAFAPLARIPGVRLISLQKGPGSEQLAALGGAFEVVDLARELDNDRTAAFMDTAAVMQHLDLVITPDTALAHLAGGLGVRVWVALSTAPDWRWMLDREDSPWYPTMRLFRQSLRGQWGDVFERMAEELRSLSSRH